MFNPVHSSASSRSELVQSRIPFDQVSNSLVRFSVTELVKPHPIVRAAAEAAIARVWEDEIGASTSVKLIFADHINHQTIGGQVRQINSMYELEDDSITLALGTITERHPHLPLESLALLHAGHEGRHRVQAHIGDPATYACITMENDNTYTDSRHEVEAWESAVNTFNALCPNDTVSFTIGTRTYNSRSS